MKPEFGKGQRPREQWPIIAPAGKRRQEKWLVGCFSDRLFSLFDTTETGTGPPPWTLPASYSELWTTLANMPLAKGKWWLIGHRVRYALEQANILEALEDGSVSLPRSKKKGEGHKRAGKLAYSMNCLEIDLVCGKNNLKIMDWKNYGFEPKEALADINPIEQAAALAYWIDYVTLCRETGLLLTKTTAAQMGWQHARMNYGPPVLMYNLDPSARALERRAYFGGRNEAYRLGDVEDAVFSLDVKSSYAAICQTCKIPVYMKEDFPLGLPAEDVTATDDEQWIADVVLSSPAPDYPVRHNGIILYPTGNFYTSLAWPELQHALQRGRVEKVLRAAKYHASLAMKGYAEWYLRARQVIADSGVKHMDAALKSAFNGSLGYTARQRYELLPWEMDIDRDWWIGYTSAPDHSAPIVHAQVLGGVKEWLKVGGEPREAMPFLHATICSWARIILLNIMEAAQRDWVYYCDTDGILVDYRGYANLRDTPGMIGEEPGQLGQRFKSAPCRIQGQKNYKIGEQVICSGMVRTRDSVWQQKRVLETPTGRSNAEGRITPFEFRCQDIGDEERKYINFMA